VRRARRNALRSSSRAFTFNLSAISDAERSPWMKLLDHMYELFIFETDNFVVSEKLNLPAIPITN